MDPISIGLAGAGLLANFIGQQQAAKRMREGNQLVNKQIADLTAWKELETDRPYLESNVGRNIMTKATEQFRKQAQQAQSTAAVTGASDEAVIAQKAAAGENLAGVASNVAAQGAVREDQINQQYRSNLSNLLAQKLGLIQGQAQSGANLASSAGSFLSSLGPSLTTGTGKGKVPGVTVEPGAEDLPKLA
jgi:hypothetical protein